MTEFTRGSTIRFNSEFVDNQGNAFVADAATLTLSYTSKAGRATTEELTMIGAAASWSVEWDSGNARPTTVYYSARAEAGSEVVVKDGDFDLTANSANISI